MSGMSIYGRSQLLYSLFARDQANYPPYLWLALSGIVPMAGDSGIHLDEPTDPAYGRIRTATTSAWWAPSGSGTLANAQVLSFASPTVDWGLIAGWALVDSASGGGNLYVVGELTTPARVVAGPDAAVVIDIGALQIVQL